MLFMMEQKIWKFIVRSDLENEIRFTILSSLSNLWWNCAVSSGNHFYMIVFTCVALNISSPCWALYHFHTVFKLFYTQMIFSEWCEACKSHPYKHQADCPIFFWSDVVNIEKSMAIHDTECPSWDQVSWNNTKSYFRGSHWNMVDAWNFTGWKLERKKKEEQNEKMPVNKTYTTC